MAKGNPLGQIRAKPFREALMMELASAGEDHKALRRVAQALIAKSMDGDISAMKELLDRVDGKVPQGIGGADDLPPIKGFAWIDPKTTA